MFKTLGLQKDISELQVRPYVFLVPQENTTYAIDKNHPKIVFDVNNRTNFPASKVRSYGLVFVNDVAVYGINCFPLSDKDPNEIIELFEAEHNCQTKHPPISFNGIKYRACVSNNLSTTDIPPNQKFSLHISLPKKHLDSLLNQANPETSGIVMNTIFEDPFTQNSFSSRLAILPYIDTPGNYLMKVF